MQEVWFWRDDRIRIWVLEGEGYTEATRSRVLRDLDPGLLTSLLDRPTALQAVRALRDLLRG